MYDVAELRALHTGHEKYFRLIYSLCSHSQWQCEFTFFLNQVPFSNFRPIRPLHLAKSASVAQNTHQCWIYKYTKFSDVLRYFFPNKIPHWQPEICMKVASTPGLNHEILLVTIGWCRLHLVTNSVMAIRVQCKQGFLVWETRETLIDWADVTLHFVFICILNILELSARDNSSFVHRILHMLCLVTKPLKHWRMLHTSSIYMRSKPILDNFCN